jgi:hypothetical protein
MRISAYFRAVPVAAILAAGCDPATSAPPLEPTKADVPQLDSNNGSRVALKKKKKEPGVVTVPRTSTKPKSSL